MVLEWIAGEEGKGADLRGWLRHGPLELRIALEITIDVARGLIHAQQKQPGLVHRDLKPENILVVQGGLAKITDFGLAQIVEQSRLEITEELGANIDRHNLLGQGELVGTPAYMSPEQWRGEGLNVRTDLYALGCILYELLTGTWPFQVEVASARVQGYRQWLMALRAKHERDKPAVLPTSVPSGVRQMVQSCLAKMPDERPAGPEELLVCLERLYQEQFGVPAPAILDIGEMTSGDYINRGVTYRNLKRYEAAMADYSQATEMDPDNVLVYSNRGNIYYTLQKYEAAMADYDRAINLDSHYAPAYYNRGLTYKVLERYEDAIVDFDRAIAVDSGFAMAYSSRGNTYQALRQYKTAIADYDRAIELDPDDAQVYYNRGTTYAALQWYDRALADYDRAIKLNPSYTKAYSNRGLTYKTLQQYEVALADFNRVIELDPSDAKTYSNRGNTYQALRQYEAAIADYNRAVEFDPGFAKAYFNLGALLHNLGQLCEALSYFEKAAELGVPQGAQHAAQIRQRLGIEPKPKADPTQHAI